MNSVNGTRATARARKSTCGLTSFLFAKGKPRSALLAGASTIAFAALGSLAAEAACVPSLQTISILNYPGPVSGNGGDIAVNTGASVAGGPTGVYASSCGIGALSNSGGISWASPAAAPIVGGIGVLVNLGQTIGSLSNLAGATIAGGIGGNGPTQNFAGAAGGAGVSNAGTIASLTNGGSISGGGGGSGGLGGSGGAGVSNAGALTTLTNGGKISGGNGGHGNGPGGIGGAGVSNSGTIATLTNSGTISGGNGGNAPFGGAAGIGVSNAGTITTLTNSGTISGGAGGGGSYGGAGGTAVVNTGAINALTTPEPSKAGAPGPPLTGATAAWACRTPATSRR